MSDEKGCRNPRRRQIGVLRAKLQSASAFREFNITLKNNNLVLVDEGITWFIDTEREK